MGKGGYDDMSKIKNKVIRVKGLSYFLPLDRLKEKTFDVIITNDEQGKTISIDNGISQFSIPFEPIEQYLK